MIGWLMQRGIEPHVPLLDREHQTHGFFTRADFAFDTENNVFICPGRKHLRSTGLVRPDGTMPYWASTTDCRACSLRLRRAKGIVTRIHAATSRAMRITASDPLAVTRTAEEKQRRTYSPLTLWLDRLGPIRLVEVENCWPLLKGCCLTQSRESPPIGPPLLATYM